MRTEGTTLVKETDMRPTAILRRLRGFAPAAMASLLVALTALPAAALEEPAGEKEALKACEKSLCTMVLDKSAAGGDLACDVQKTWAKSDLEEGKSKGVSWGFGDARCKVDLKLGRADIVAALTKPKHTVKIPAHQVTCVIEREGELKPLTAKVAPKLTFKGGKADKVWINLEEIEGPADVKSTIWAAANLEDTIGIFHRPMIKQINKFLYKQCPKRYGTQVAVKAKPPVAKKKPPATPAAVKPEAAKPAAKPDAAKAAAPPAKPVEAAKAPAPPAKPPVKEAAPAAKDATPPPPKTASTP
jgi:hypothetical protein